MEKKKNKGLKIALIITGIIVVLAIAVSVLLPRFLLLFAAKQADKLASGTFEAKMFTDYDVTDDSLIMTKAHGINIGIPSGFAKQDLGELEAVSYSNEENGKGVIILPAHDCSYMNFNAIADAAASSAADKKTPGYRISSEDFIETFESFGNGSPDSAYNTLKATYLLDKDDYSFWDIKKGTAYVLLTAIKSTAPPFSDVMYIYETDDVKAFIQIKPDEEAGVVKAQMEIFSANDLNTSNAVVIGADSAEDVYAIINSISFDE